MGNELYIGAPNGVMLCIDGIDSRGCRGSFYHAYAHEPVGFESLGEMLFRMEALFDRLNFPRRGNAERFFVEEHRDGHGGNAQGGRRTADGEGKEKVMSDQELLSHKGQQETFIVRVQHRQNNTWQGRITWADKNKTLTFRSIWEMVHLMETALYEGASPEEIPDVRSWKDE